MELENWNSADANVHRCRKGSDRRRLNAMKLKDSAFYEVIEFEAGNGGGGLLLPSIDSAHLFHRLYTEYRLHGTQLRVHIGPGNLNGDAIAAFLNAHCDGFYILV